MIRFSGVSKNLINFTLSKKIFFWKNNYEQPLSTKRLRARKEIIMTSQDYKNTSKKCLLSFWYSGKSESAVILVNEIASQKLNSSGCIAQILHHRK